ncbi:MAG: hypothetical protein FJ276_12635 [Planctomycetes bacterium]|nr:hypothetical protein [Planctomycetota bacterium]
MERLQDGRPPMLKADLDSLKRELEQLHYAAKPTCCKRRGQMAPSMSAAMVIQRKSVLPNVSPPLRR